MSDRFVKARSEADDRYCSIDSSHLKKSFTGFLSHFKFRPTTSIHRRLRFVMITLSWHSATRNDRTEAFFGSKILSTPITHRTRQSAELFAPPTDECWAKRTAISTQAKNGKFGLVSRRDFEAEHERTQRRLPRQFGLF